MKSLPCFCRRWLKLSLLLLLVLRIDSSKAFTFGRRVPLSVQPHKQNHHRQQASSTCLFGKGFRGAQNKQAALAKKLELAKKQQQQKDSGIDEKEEDESVTQQEGDKKKKLEKKKVEDDDAHAEFAKLLAKNQPIHQPNEQSENWTSSNT